MRHRKSWRGSFDEGENKSPSGSNALLEIADLPGGTSGWRKKTGVVFYVMCTMLAMLLVGSFLSESEQFYTKDYESEGGEFSGSIENRLPDVVICPSHSLDEDQEFAVFYERHLISEIGMDMKNVTELTRLYYKSCGTGEKCRGSMTPCSGTKFEDYCRKVANLIDQSKGRNFTRIDEANKDTADPDSKEKIMPWHAKVLYAELKSNSYVWTLHHLWLAIVEGGHVEIRKSLHKNFGNDSWPRFMCRLYDLKRGRNKDAEDVCNSVQVRHNVWLGKTLCEWIDSSLMPTATTPSLGLTEDRRKIYNLLTRTQKREPIRYWVGNLRYSKVTEACLTSLHRKIPRFTEKQTYKIMPRISAMVQYVSYVLEEEDGKDTKCYDQAELKGVRIECGETSSKRDTDFKLNSSQSQHTKSLTRYSKKWFYDVSYDSQGSRVLLWIYPGTKDRIVQAKSYTLYTLCQITIGIFGSCIGLCVIQVIEALLLFLNKLRLAQALKPSAVRGITLCILFAVTGVLTYQDIKSYVENRIGKQVERRRVQNLPIPVVQVCNGGASFAFWNVTRLYELNVSAMLYTYLRVAVMQQKMPSLYATHRQIWDGKKMKRFLINDWIKTDSPFRSECKKSMKFCLVKAQEIACPACEIFWLSKQRKKQIGIKRFTFSNKRYERKTKQIMKELDKLRERLNLPVESPLADYIKPLSLDISNGTFMKCKIGNKIVQNCQKYARYTREIVKGPSHCITITIPNHLYKMKAGNGEALSIQIDGRAYQEHSDINGFYGFDFPRSQVLKNPLETRCTKYNNKKIGCLVPTSFLVRFIHPEGGNYPMQTSFSNIGPTGGNGLAMNIRNTFKSVIESENDCVVEKDRVCNFGIDEVGSILRAIQSQISCQCLNCFDLTDGQHRKLEGMMNASLHCCTPREDVDCTPKYIGKMELRSDGRNYNYTTKNAKQLQALRHINYVPRNLLHKSTKITNRLVRKILGLPRGEQPPFLSTLMSYLKRCKQQRCSEKMLKLVSVRKTSTNGRYDEIKLFYDTQYEEGTTQIDRLDPAQFVGVLFCSYGTTIGISLLALVELLMLTFFGMISMDSGGTSDMGESFARKQFLRGLSILLTPKNQSVKKISSSGVTTIHKLSTESNSPPTQTSSTPVENMKDTLTKPISRMNSNNKIVPVKNFEGNENSQSCSGEIYNANISEKKHGKILLFARYLTTTFCICMLAALITYFFTKSLTSNVSMEILQSPRASPPSIGLCLSAEKQTKDAVISLMESAKCNGDRADKFIACTAYFSMITSSAKSICAVWDRSRAMNQLDLQSTDVELRVPLNVTTEKIYIWVNGLNETSVTDQEPSIQWSARTDLILSYTATKFQDLTRSCQVSEEKECESCHHSAKNESVCCLEEKQPLPLQLEGPTESCFHYTFSTIVFSPKTSAKTSFRKMTLGAKSEFIIVTSIKSKYNWISYLSLLGGFFDFFTGLNVLNTVCFVFFSMCTVSKGLLTLNHKKIRIQED